VFVRSRDELPCARAAAQVLICLQMAPPAADLRLAGGSVAKIACSDGAIVLFSPRSGRDKIIEEADDASTFGFLAAFLTIADASAQTGQLAPIPTPLLFPQGSSVFKWYFDMRGMIELHATFETDFGAVESVTGRGLSRAISPLASSCSL
jgi:hypothetical protein